MIQNRKMRTYACLETLMSWEASGYPLPTPTPNTNQTCAIESAIESHRAYTCWKAFIFILLSSFFISGASQWGIELNFD